jgi:hypothetical protein
MWDVPQEALGVSAWGRGWAWLRGPEPPDAPPDWRPAEAQVEAARDVRLAEPAGALNAAEAAQPGPAQAAGPQPGAAEAAADASRAVRAEAAASDGPGPPRAAAGVENAGGPPRAAAPQGAPEQRAGEAAVVVAGQPGGRQAAPEVQQAVPWEPPSAAASAFRQGPSPATELAPPRWGARFARAMRHLPIASRSGPSWQAARNEDWS